jgi:hypothetical protein
MFKCDDYFEANNVTGGHDPGSGVFLSLDPGSGFGIQNGKKIRIRDES